MPRNYRRKQPDRTPVTEAQIFHAKELLAKGKRAAASAIGISESCLRKRLKLDTTSSSLGRWKPTFNTEQEAEFVNHCKKMDERYFGLTINDLRRRAYEYAEANKIENRFDSGCKMAGRDWVESFLKRHPDLTLRQSTATSLARVIGFDKVQIDRFYKNLDEVYKRYKIKPNRIYNVDETGMSTVPKKTPKVVSTKGKNVVGKVVSAERGITVTAICCMSAAGHYVPPAFIVPRKSNRDDLINDAPSHSISMVSDSGFVNTDLFVTWLKHFQSFVYATPEDPVLMLLDNHSSHISLEAVNYAREQNIIMLTLPPHGSHKLQPLDRSFFGPLKA
ncbi:MFS-type transporter clz9-like [Cotesia glomerata]|uniref:MFS-type transporter clz9-like n=1 Tax=Cotesia glomerata TaxID=32391 RepID=UPI001D02145F|nr:MFS-type transporter clz9-like [Cotesia glomerata]